jgi:hypothetical protein
MVFYKHDEKGVFDMTTTVLPSVNLNGTSRNELIEQNLQALRSLRTAAEMIRFAAPNGRDYPDPEVYKAARAAFDANIASIRCMIAGYERTLEHLVDSE